MLLKEEEGNPKKKKEKESPHPDSRSPNSSPCHEEEEEEECCVTLELLVNAEDGSLRLTVMQGKHGLSPSLLRTDVPPPAIGGGPFLMAHFTLLAPQAWGAASAVALRGHDQQHLALAHLL